MVFSFGAFELDEGKRELRLRGRALDLQPRVFDVLAYLIRHRERVVPKEELLEAIWPDVMVTDSSVMRAASVIRSILREGTSDELIQNYPRQGYRFVGEIDLAPRQKAKDQDLERARAASASGDWGQALQAFQHLPESASLQASDLEQWAHVAQCLGQPNDAIYPLQRSIAAHVENADRIGAARAAQTLANIHLEGRELAIAKGWLRRAEAFLGDEPHETREHGMQLWLGARVALTEGDLPECLKKAEAAEAVAKRCEDTDIETLSLVYRAHIALATGGIREGLVLLDEAGTAVLAGMVSPWVCGYIFCSVIWAYLDRGDLHRAGQWTDQFINWSKRHCSFGYPGLCRLHRGEVLCAQGKLNAAEREIVKAQELLADNARYAEGDAFRVLGEIRLLRGDIEGAQEAFQRAHELGWHPLPGWALVQEENGRHAAAIKSLQRGLQFPSWADGQRKAILLAHLVRIAARSGNVELARSSFSELDSAPELRNTPGSEAAYHRAKAELADAEGHADEAIAAMRSAISVWRDAGSRINVAHAQLRLSEILAAAGEETDAGIELTAAGKGFAAMDADPMVERCRRMTSGSAGGARRIR